MSDTPRTDAQYKHPASPTWEVAYEGMTLLARELERSLSEEQRRAQDAVTRGLKMAEALREIASYTGTGPPTTPWQAIVKDITDHARAALEEAQK